MSNPFSRGTDQFSTGTSQLQQQQSLGAAAVHRHIPETGAASGAVTTSPRYSYGAPFDGGGSIDIPLHRSSSGGSSTGSGYGGSGTGLSVPTMTRRMREFIPESKKDDEYWLKRQKNNEAAKRSREKRRANDAVMARRIHELSTENKRLKMELSALRRQFGLPPLSTAPAIVHSMPESIASTSDDGGPLSPQHPDVTPLNSADVAAAAAAASLAVSPSDSRILGGYSNHHRTSDESSAHPCNSTSTSASVSFATSAGRTLLPFAYDRSSTSGTLPPIANLYVPLPATSAAVDTRTSRPLPNHRPETSYSFNRGRPLNAQEIFHSKSNTCHSADHASVLINSDLSSSNDSMSNDYDGYSQQVDEVAKRQKMSFALNRSHSFLDRNPPLSVNTEGPLNLTSQSHHGSPVGFEYHGEVWMGKIEHVDDAEKLDTSNNIRQTRENYPSSVSSRSILSSNSYTRPPTGSNLVEVSVPALQCIHSGAVVARNYEYEPPATRSLSLPSVEAVTWRQRLNESAVDARPHSKAAAPPVELSYPESPVHESRHVRGGVPLKVWHKLAASRADVADMPSLDEERFSSRTSIQSMLPSSRIPTAVTAYRSLSTEGSSINHQRLLYDHRPVPLSGDHQSAALTVRSTESGPVVIQQRDTSRQLWRRPEDQELLDLLVQQQRGGSARVTEAPQHQLSPM